MLKSIVLALAPAFATMASASLLNVGYISYDVTAPGSTASFDIVNQTGPNSTAFPDTSFPISTSVHLSSLILVVHFSDSTTQ
ncbi:MAG TPA: hypothetical protein VG456_09650, partial [Candidatus Sulfopaludibacter sp.]|nr:hypothetical protein [Candidatus Sulfopaludibacter sp.]